MSSAKISDALPSREDACTPSCDRERSKGSSKSSTTVQFISDAALFLQIFAFATAVPQLLRLKLSRVAGLLELSGYHSVSHAPEHRVKKITACVEFAIQHGRPIVRPGCLTRGLTRYYFLRRAGMDVTLCFGMGRLDNEFIGHCWLIKDGEPFLEAEDPRPRYVEIYRISRAGGQASVPGGPGELQRFSDS